jgi:hypothetical protein
MLDPVMAGLGAELLASDSPAQDHLLWCAAADRLEETGAAAEAIFAARTLAACWAVCERPRDPVGRSHAPRAWEPRPLAVLVFLPELTTELYDQFYSAYSVGGQPAWLKARSSPEAAGRGVAMMPRTLGCLMARHWAGEIDFGLAPDAVPPTRWAELQVRHGPHREMWSWRYREEVRKAVDLDARMTRAAGGHGQPVAVVAAGNYMSEVAALMAGIGFARKIGKTYSTRR